MIDRLLITAGILLACAAGYVLLLGYLALRRRRLLESAPISDTKRASGEGAERPTLVYFSTAECGRCRDQARAVDALAASFGERLRVWKVDALAEPDLAERYGVLTVPTTVVLDGAARPRSVNYGFAPAAKLETQLRELLTQQALAA